ncbi:glycine zipper domain-containing protein [Pontibacter toksunensis]|uniref:Glycine zipper domain-containing protein n=1 Tax=Pontibacter toksunensis TaxID=1332631 RepID=A0ABW6BZX1_9BACT
MKKVSYILCLVLLAVVVFQVPALAQNRKWSPQAKGTVIGAATGAAAGAVIHKRNRVIGGVVGGVVGGGAGYAVGKHIDNKNKEKEAARIAEENRIAAANRAAAEAAANERAVARRTIEEKPAVARRTPARKTEVAPAVPAVALLHSYRAVQDPVMSMALLPNESYGDPTKPYYTSEYRRKSW